MVEKEYESLRKEILLWQNRRFTVASASLVAVAGILGWTLNNPYAFSWATVAAVLVLVISIACCLSYLFGLSKTKISTYIEIFHETEESGMGWERRQKALKGASTRKAFSILYACVGWIGGGMAWIFCKKQPNGLEILLLSILALFSVLTIWWHGWKAAPYEKYHQRWLDVKNEDALAISRKTLE